MRLVGNFVMMYGAYWLWRSLYSLLFFHIGWLDDYIIAGKMDRFMIRPLSPFLQLLGEEVNVNGISDVVFGVAF